MIVPFVDLKAHHGPLQEELLETLGQVVSHSAFIRGQHVEQFEKDFSTYIGASHCIGVGNGTDALYVSLSALDVGPGDEVITVANSFIATSEAITRTGAKVVFVDCDPTSYTIDVDRIKCCISSKTKAIIPVHLYGYPAKMDAIMDIAKRYNLRVIEDAAQAHGAIFQNGKVGTLGDCACFSFYPGKNLGAMGDAGAIVTNNDLLAKRARMFANHGRMSKYDHEFEGINSRMDGFQGAVLGVKLTHLDDWNNRRREVAHRYDEALSGICRTPRVSENVHHVYHLYVVRVGRRDEVRTKLSERGISTGIHYPIPLPSLKAYQYLGHQPNDFPVTNRLKGEILSLPIHGEIREEEVNYVIGNFIEVVSNLSAKVKDDQYEHVESQICPDRLRRHCA